MSAEAEEGRYDAEVRANLRRNYAAHLAHGLLGQTGFRLLNAPTFIPAYLSMISGSEFFVGLARALQSFGMFLSPILGATLIEHRRRVLPIGFAVGGAMRLQVLGIALACFFFAYPWNLAAILLFLSLFGFFMGMQGVVFNYLMSKVIPVDVRGFLLGLRNFLAGLTTIVVAYIGGHLLDAQALGNGYGAIFLTAFVLTTCGLAMLLLVREPEPPEVREASRVGQRLRELPALLRDDPEFTRYFLARALATMGRMAVPFYILYVDEVVGLTGTTLGTLSTAFLAAQSTTNLLWGWIADRTGFRLILILALVCWILSAVLLMNSSALPGFVVAFFGIGAGLGGFMLASQNLVLEFGLREDLPMRIAVANSASELVGALGPLLGGMIASVWSVLAVFWVGTGFQIVAVLVVLLFVPEPRRR